MAPLPPPSIPPQVASVQTPAQQTPIIPATSARFKDLTPAQARWLEVLEKHGILRTNPASQLFGPEQEVRRDEMLMSESRLVELILHRDQEQQALIDRLKDEIADLRTQQVPVAALSLPALKPAPLPTLQVAPPALSLATPVQLPPSLARPDTVLLPESRMPVPPEPLPTTVSAAQPVRAASLLSPIEVQSPEPLEAHVDRPVRVTSLLSAVKVQVPEPLEAHADCPERSVQVLHSEAPASEIDLASLVRHRNRLRQFPYLQRFLTKAAHLNPTDNGYHEYVRTYLVSAGMTPAMLAEAARQAAYFDLQPV